ncbi:MAG: Hypothetical protein C75L2_00270011, partial [Leptospirillum sp. Group II 'C75']
PIHCGSRINKSMSRLILWLNSSISLVPPPRRGDRRPLPADASASNTIWAALFSRSFQLPDTSQRSISILLIRGMGPPVVKESLFPTQGRAEKASL